MDEEPLQRAIMAAISSVMAPKEKINGLITDAALEETGKLPNSAMTLGDTNRRLEKLEAEELPVLVKTLDALTEFFTGYSQKDAGRSGS